jgi:hypothetical protein
VAEEGGRTRLLHRQVPAVVVSGMAHIIVVAGFLFYFKLFPDDVKARDVREAPALTRLDDPPFNEPDPVDPARGIDVDLPPGAEARELGELNFDGPLVPEPPALPGPEDDLPRPAMNLGDPTRMGLDTGSEGREGLGAVGPGQPGVGGQLALPGFVGRPAGATRDRLVRILGGNDDTEAAVALALAWLAKQQNASGYWEFDGTAKSDRVAATGMCLLPFLAAGETHITGAKYKAHIARGLAYLRSQQRPTGQFAESGMYAQAIATIALCELAGMTQDDRVKKSARLAIDFIVKAQAGNGSWGYTAGNEGDTSIVGWQIQALKSARLAGIPVPDKTFKQAETFLESVSDSGATYGYRTKGPTHSLTAVGLLSRQYMGWSPRVSQLARGVRWLWDGYKPRDDDWNMYYYYYATQVFHFFGGREWTAWNEVMRELLLKKQVTDKTPRAKSADIGSWPKDNGFIGDNCGKLGTTALSCLTLEVYYRYLPLYKRDGGGLRELER